MPYIKDQPLTEEEQTLWDKLVTQCKKVNEAIDKGYILINRHGDLLKGKFVFESGIITFDGTMIEVFGLLSNKYTFAKAPGNTLP